ncbi:MAG: hypothetical protein NTZ16_05300 [Verrucomicrobia bacterium]|nr:hypothetical protein [Verrucomicrobiota bacterium]
MKINKYICALGVVSLVPPAGAERAEDGGFLNQVRVSTRIGLNVKARFGARQPASGGYNFIDGYVLPDSKAADGGLPFAFDPTGTYPGGITHNWGYDNSARQNDALNREILLTTLAGGDPLAQSEDAGALPGVELSYQRELGTHGKWRYGAEVALNFFNVCMNSSVSYTGGADQYRFPYTFNGVVGNVPPAVYQGTYNIDFGGPNFDISGLPSSSSPVPVSIAGRHKFDADIWGLRVGPYLSHPLGKHAEISFVGGFAAALVDGRAEWSETSTINGVTDPAQAGAGHGCDVLWGYYVGVNLAWHVSERWDLNVGVQYQDLGVYRQSAGSRTAEIDMSDAIYITAGVSYKF